MSKRRKTVAAVLVLSAVTFLVCARLIPISTKESNYVQTCSQTTHYKYRVVTLFGDQEFDHHAYKAGIYPKNPSSSVLEIMCYPTATPLKLNLYLW